MCPAGSVTVFIVSDVPLYGRGLVHVLTQEGQLDVVGSAGDWAEGIDRISSLPVQPRVLIADIERPIEPGQTRDLATALPGLPILALISPDDEQAIVGWAEAGALGLVSRRVTLFELVRRIEEVAEGRTVCTSQLTATLLRRVSALAREDGSAPGPPNLTSRERQVVHLLAQGLSTKEIAGCLDIELATVKNHVHHILGKLNARRRGEAVAMLRDERTDPAQAARFRRTGARVS
jgi:DNA-binding NarL/FixJ family response regulator